MPHTTDRFRAADGVQIFTAAWLPDGKPKAVVLLVHGYGEHIMRYRHVAERLVSAGYAFYGLDHRGHGQSDGLRAYFESFDQPVHDLKLYFDQVKAAQPGQKMFLYGHSMGSLISLEFTLRYQDQLAGLILSGTAVNADEAVSPALVTLSGVLSRLIPTVPLTPPLPSDALSRDPAVASAYDNDPLVYRGNWRSRTGALILASGRASRTRAGELKLPLLILHGAEDKIVPPSGSKLIAERAGSPDKALKLYPGLRHEVHNEPEKDVVIGDVVAWLDQRSYNRQ
jgi:alpha-beta hydrolase superfamily lysophospholipase